MQSNFDNNLFGRDNFKYVEVNNTGDELKHKKYLHCARNAQKIMKKLERSLQKSNQYEDRLLKCRMSHQHVHDSNDFTKSSCSDMKDSIISNEDCRYQKSLNNQQGLTESWSIMSLVCLEHKYEELSKQYNSLLKTYNDCCSSISSYNNQFVKLEKRFKKVNKEVISLNETILAIGNKYLTLKHSKVIQKLSYENRIENLKSAIHAILVTAEKARLELNEEETERDREHDVAIALLLEEINKCNLSFMESLKSKSQQKNCK